MWVLMADLPVTMVERNSLFARKRYITALLSCSIHGMGEGAEINASISAAELGLDICVHVSMLELHNVQFADSTNQLSIE